MTDHDVIQLLSKSKKGSEYINKPYRDNPVFVLPKILSNSKEHLHFLRSMSDVFSKYDVTTPGNGYLDYGTMVNSCFHIRQVAGFPFNPLGSPSPQVKTKIPNDELEILSFVTQLMTDTFIPTGIGINSISHSGYDKMINNVIFKTNKLYEAVKDFDEILRLVRVWHSNNEFDIIEALYVIGISAIYLAGRRQQHTETVSFENGKYIPKIRMVHDFYGNQKRVDRTLDFANDLFRNRIRLVYGLPCEWAVMQYFAASVRSGYSDKYGTLFYHTKKDIEQILSNWPFILGVDISDFDKRVSQPHHDVIRNNFKCFNDDLKMVLDFLISIPMIIKNDYIGKKGVKVLNFNNGKVTNGVKYGNPSGWPFVSDYAKIIGLSTQINALTKAGIIEVSKSAIHDLMIGKNNRVRILNCGDDGVLLFKNLEDKNACLKTLGSIKSFKVTHEETVTYQGINFIQSQKSVTGVLDIRNLILKIHVPERGFNSKVRRYASFGFWARLEEYRNHPIFDNLWADYENTFKKTFSATLADVVKIDEYPPVSVTGINWADLVFLNNPAAIHYKIKPEDVSEELLKQYYSFVTADKFASLNKNIKKEYIK